MRTIGALAASDATAWRRVKQAKDMPRQVLTARIGIHHRLLFRVETRSSEVIDCGDTGELARDPQASARFSSLRPVSY